MFLRTIVRISRITRKWRIARLVDGGRYAFYPFWSGAVVLRVVPVCSFDGEVGPGGVLEAVE